MAEVSGRKAHVFQWLGVMGLKLRFHISEGITRDAYDLPPTTRSACCRRILCALDTRRPGNRLLGWHGPRIWQQRQVARGDLPDLLRIQRGPDELQPVPADQPERLGHRA